MLLSTLTSIGPMPQTSSYSKISGESCQLCPSKVNQHSSSCRTTFSQKLSGAPVAPDTMLLAAIADALRILVWQNTEDGHRGKNAPRSILETMTGGRSSGVGFDTAEDFEAWRAKMIGGDDSA